MGRPVCRPVFCVALWVTDSSLSLRMTILMKNATCHCEAKPWQSVTFCTPPCLSLNQSLRHGKPCHIPFAVPKSCYGL